MTLQGCELKQVHPVSFENELNAAVTEIANAVEKNDIRSHHCHEYILVNAGP